MQTMKNVNKQSLIIRPIFMPPGIFNINTESSDIFSYKKLFLF